MHHKSPWENPRTDTRIYILKQGDKYTYAMKQFWKTSYFHRQTWEEIDSVKWFTDSIYFEELFPLGVYFGRPKYGEIYQGDICLSLEQDYYVLGYRKTGKDVSFSMISEDGRVVYPASSLSMGTETQLNVSHLAKGVYFINFTGAQGNLVQKVILK